MNMKLPVHSLPWPDDNTIQMAIVGSLDGNKGQDTALEVLSNPQWKQRDWQLNLYGQGEGKNYLHQLATFYGISDKVFFYGHVNDINDVWQTNQILLLPSAAEGLPISLVEAMACGRPSIVTDVGGNTELIVENETGFVAASPTTESFSDAMERAWFNLNTWKKLGLNAFEKIKILLDINPEINIYETLKNGK
jgi:glycosyltransferase involved in cell wall biosynthesis